MESVTDPFGRELAIVGIAVCILQLGAVRTHLWGESIGEGDGCFDNLPQAVCRSYARGDTTMRKTCVEKSGRGAPTEALAAR